MQKNLRVLFIGSNKIFIDAIIKQFKELGYEIDYYHSYSIADITDKLKGKSWDLLISLVDRVSICTDKVSPLIERYAKNTPWLALVYQVSKNDRFRLLDAGCNEVIALENLRELGYILYRSFAEAKKKDSQSLLLNEALAKKEELSFILSSIGDGIITVDNQERILRMNGMAEIITGWEADFALGKPLQEIFKLIDLNTKEPYHDLIEQSIFSGRTLGLKKDTVIVTKEGKEKYLSASISPIKISGDIIGVVIVFRDITRIRQTEIDLLVEQRNLGLLFDAAPIGLLLVDGMGTIKKTNKAILKIINREETKVVGFRLGVGLGCQNSFLKVEDSQKNPHCQGCQIWQILKDTLAQKREPTTLGVDVQYAIVTPTGKKKLWLKINSVPIFMDNEMHVMLVIDNITDIKLAEEGLKRYQLLSQHANDIIIFSDIDGKIIEANEAALAAFGYSKKEITAKSIFALMDPDTRTKVRPQYHKASGAGIYYEAMAKKKNGETFPVEVSLQSSEIGESRALLSIQRDITERKIAQKELEEAREKAEEANLAKSEFLANMSHEIRTPLNGMLGMIDLTLLTSLSQEQKDNLYIAKDCARSLLNLINDILDFSKIEARKMTIEEIDFSLPELLEQVIKSHMLKAREKGLTLTSYIDPKIPHFLKGDPNRLKQILNNLLSNALKFTDAGGIELTANLHMLYKEKVDLTVSVADTGIGIAQKDLARIFGTFNQADNTITRRFGGTGLGLPISKQLVEMMGGSMGVESVKDLGSKFYFSLCLAKGTELRAEEGQVKAIKKTLKPLRILLAEDDRVNQLVLLRMIKEAGHQVDAVNDGLEFLQMLNVQDYDLLLLDIQMPKLDGLETAKRIRDIEKKKGGHIPIIAISAYALAGDREKFLAQGLDEYLAKPVQINNLLQVIEEIGEKFIGGASPSFIGEFPASLLALDQDEEVRGEKEDRTSLTVVIENLGKYIENLNAAYQKRNYEQIEVNAGRIKAKLTLEPFAPLRRLIFKVEMAARKEDMEAIDEYLKAFIEGFNELQENLGGKKSKGGIS